MKLSLDVLFRYAPKIIELVTSVKGLFGGGKSGTEKKELVKSSILNGEEIVEGLANKDLFNGEAAGALLDEAVEVGYQAMKDREAYEARIRAILEQVKTLKPQG